MRTSAVMDDQSCMRTRIGSVIAATVMSLACGTNYAYSAWGPQLAVRMQFTATQGELIGTAGNLGMYACGIPLGLLVDAKGPRPAALLGAFCLGVGYYPIKRAFDSGAGSSSVAFLFFLSFLTGVGSCSAFQAALKTCALNWPHHSGTATAFPLAAFGLSAVFFTTLSGIIFHGDTSHFLLLLTTGTFGLALISTIFLTVVPGSLTHYSILSTGDRSDLRQRRDSNPLHRTKSGSSRNSGSETDTDNIPSIAEEQDVSESSSLISSPGDIVDEHDGKRSRTHISHRPDISGLALLRNMEFWQLWCLCSLLTGTGLMTINNIGNDTRALWQHWDDTADKSFIFKRQLMQVSILSVMSFGGRLLSGIGSDLLVKKLHMSRFWCLVVSSIIFSCAQFAGMKVEDPNFLWLVSGLTGLAYGALFGVYPALIVDAFGVTGFSVNWGFMTLAPVLSGNIFNICYGAIYDRHSTTSPSGERECPDGLKCYSTAYEITLASSCIGILLTFWCIRYNHIRSGERSLQADHREV